MNHDLVVFIGRFQPFHNIHEEILREAFKHSNNVLILLGSPQESRTERNPWTAGERARMIEKVLDDLPSDVTQGKQSFIDLVPDHPDDNEWKSYVVDSVEDVLYEIGYPRASDASVALIGAQKDETGFWLTMFPSYGLIFTHIRGGYSGTDIRDRYFNGTSGEQDHCLCHVPHQVRRILETEQPMELTYDV